MNRYACLVLYGSEINKTVCNETKQNETKRYNKKKRETNKYIRHSTNMRLDTCTFRENKNVFVTSKIVKTKQTDVNEMYLRSTKKTQTNV